MGNSPNHQAIFLSNKADKQFFIHQLLNKKAVGSFADFNQLNGVLFSSIAINQMIAEEDRHGNLAAITKGVTPIRLLSGGEQKKMLLNYLLHQQPGFIIADNPFDNLDTATQAELLLLLQEVALCTPIIQLINRTRDLLPFIKKGVTIARDNTLLPLIDITAYLLQHQKIAVPVYINPLPVGNHEYAEEQNPLVAFKNVTVQYNDRVIVTNINWQINKGECWQLIGSNGSGKSTLLSLITGDNPKAFGQNIVLFGKRKGSGESVWSIKEKIGYFTASMMDLFGRYSTVEQMVVSGFFDSIGLYTKPSPRQQKLADEWLKLVGMQAQKNTPFFKLSLGQQRLMMIVRAMVKHPPLLILDEPTVGLDDENVAIVIALVNKILAETNTAIIFVAHQIEAALSPKFIYALSSGQFGSTGSQLEH